MQIPICAKNVYRYMEQLIYDERREAVFDELFEGMMDQRTHSLLSVVSKRTRGLSICGPFTAGGSVV